MEAWGLKFMKNVGVLLLWLLVWQAAGMLIHNPILFATPRETLRSLLENMGNIDFWQVAGRTLLRIGTGFSLGMLFGILLAAASYVLPWMEAFLRPAIGLVKTVPVVCFVVLFLIWWGSDALSVLVSFLMVFTAVYFSTLEGLKAVSKDMLEMAKVFRLPTAAKVFYLYRPTLKPFLLGSLKTALGLAWKSGVAAEVIGLPAYSIGEKLYLSKISLDTAGIFAWTAVVCGLSVGFENFVLFLVKKAFEVSVPRKASKGRTQKARGESPGRLAVEGLGKSYGEQVVFQGFSMELMPGETMWLDWPSGAGKTTLLRILMGLESPDEGRIAGLEGNEGVCALFQEDRLLGECSALFNVTLTAGSREAAKAALEPLLDRALWEKPCGQLSGGERRRVALARALAAEGRWLFLDEPFAGLDGEWIAKAHEEILRKKGERTLLIASHVKP